MFDLSSAPEALQMLADRLAQRGSPLQVQVSESPTNQQLRAVTDHGTIQVLADRGQWIVEVAPPGATEFFDAAAWIACLNGAEVSLELLSMDEQVMWLTKFLAAAAPRHVTLECLLEARRRRAYGRLGLPIVER